jgi:photosystem II stability/assembly factor-like uncharacterized protein
MSTPSPPQIRPRPKATDGTLEFWWGPPLSDGGSAILSYTFGIADVIIDTVGADVGYYKVTGLTNGVSYMATVVATNAIGDSEPATFRRVQPGFPPGPTQNQSFTRNARGNATFSWSAPASNGGATIGWNVVSCYPIDPSGAVVRRNVLGDQTSLTIPDLSGTKTYTVLIRARNDPAYSPKTVYLPPLTFGGMPSDISGITIWLDAADLSTLFSDISGEVLSSLETKTVSLWKDKSGGNHDMTSSSPANLLRNGLSGKFPCIQLTNGNSFLSSGFDVTDTNTITTFMVAQLPTLGTTQYFLYGSSGVLSILYNSLKGGQFLFNSDGSVAGAAFPDAFLSVTSTDLTTVTNTIYNPTYTNSQTSRTGTGFSSAPLQIGGEGVTDIRISELIIWNRVLSSAERASVVSYLQNKWGFPLSLPNPVVYFVAADLSGSSVYWTDRSGNNSLATLSEGDTAKSGTNAVFLDGASAWEFANIGLQTNFSMSVWFKRGGATGSGGCIVTEGYTGGAAVNMALYGGTYGASDTQFIGGFFDGGWEIGAAVEFVQNEWTHMTVTWNGTDIKTYTNGSLVDTTNYTGLTAASTGLPYRIGKRWDNADYVLGGIGEIRIDSVALSDAEVFTYYNLTAGSYTDTGPMEVWIERQASGIEDWRCVASSADGVKLVAAVNGGYIYTSTDSGVNWGPQTTSGQESWTCIASSSDGTKLAAAVYNGYIYTSADSGATWTEQTPAGQRIWFSIASSADGTKLAAVAGADGNSIYTSTDSGATWTEQTGAGYNAWRGIASSADGTKLVAVNYHGSVWTSTDSGSSWTTVTPAGGVIWQSVACSSDGTKLVAAGYNNYIYTSADSGATWTQQTAAAQRGWAAVTSSADGTRLAAANGAGYIYISTDSGATWTEQTQAGSKLWTSITSSENGLKLVATPGGGTQRLWTYVSTEAVTPPSSLWTERIASGQRQWNSIASSADGTKLAAVANSGYIYTSTNSGATWTEQTASGQHAWSSIASSADGTKLAAVVNGGYIYTSADSGATWTEQTASGQLPWASIASSADGTKLVAVVYGGYPYISTDSGANWTQNTNVSGYLASVSCSSDGTHIAVARSQGSGDVYFSTDSGANFTQSSVVSGGWIISIASSSDGTKLAAVNNGGYIYTSTDSGATWTQQTASGQRNWTSITSSADGTHLAAAVGGSGFIYISTDSGATWTEQTDVGQQNWLSIASSSNGAKLAVGGDGTYIWTYAGTPPLSPWTERTSSGQHNWTSIASSADGTKLAALIYGDSIYTSTNSGATWTQQTGAGQRSWYSIASSADGTKLVAATYGSYIYTSTDSGASWTEQTAAATRIWWSIASSADGMKLAAAPGPNNFIYTSTDGGVTWTEQTASGQRNWHSITSSPDGTKLAAAAYTGYIYTSTDSGANWTEQTSSGQRNWFSIASSTDGTKLAAVAYGGYIYTSVDGGATWTEQTSSGQRNWFSIASSTDGTKLAAVAYGGYIYTSTDSGASWVNQFDAGQRNWARIASSSNGAKLAAGGDGTYIWTYAGPPPTSPVFVITYSGTPPIYQLDDWNMTASKAEGPAYTYVTDRWYANGTNFVSDTSLYCGGFVPYVIGNLTITYQIDTTEFGTLDASNTLIIAVNPVVTADSHTVNEGTTVNFSVDLTHNTDYSTDEWFLATSSQATNTNGVWSYQFNTAGDYYVSYAYTNTDSATFSSVQVHITVNPNYTVNVSADNSNPSAGQSITLSSSISGGSPTVNFINWDFGDGTIITSNNTSETYSYGSDGNYTVTVTYNIDAGTNIQGSTGITVSTGPPPPPPDPVFTITVDNTTKTQTDSISFNTNCDTSYSYIISDEWFIESSSAGTNTSGALTVTIPRIGINNIDYSIVCDLGNFNAQNLDMTILPVITASSLTITEGDTVTFSVDLTANGDYQNDVWYINDSPVTTNTNGSWSYQFNTAGSYDIKYEFVNQSYFTYTSGTINITVNTP